jgi:hypothetical protein
MLSIDPKQARPFLEELLPEAKDIVVRIAHLASAGRYEDAGFDQVLDLFADALAAATPLAGDGPVTLYFRLPAAGFLETSVCRGARYWGVP